MNSPPVLKNWDGFSKDCGRDGWCRLGHKVAS